MAGGELAVFGAKSMKNEALSTDNDFGWVKMHSSILKIVKMKILKYG